MSSLSQEEIDIFVKNFNNKSKSSKKEKGTSLYSPVDFSKPNKLQNENLGALKQIHENFVKSLNKILSMYLRTNMQLEMDFDDVEQIAYQNYINYGNKNSLFGVFSITEGEDELGKCFMQFKTDFCDFYIDKSTGSDFPFVPNDSIENEEVSEINKLVATGLFKKVIHAYDEVWNTANIGTFKMSNPLIEDSVQNLNLGIMNSEMILIVPIDILIFQSKEDDEEPEIERTLLKVGIPYSVIEPVIDNLNMSNLLSSGQSDISNENIEQSVSKMSNVIDCYIGEHTYTFKDIVELEVGDFVSFEKSPNDPISIYVGGVKKFLGERYQLGSKNCLKIIKQED